MKTTHAKSPREGSSRHKDTKCEAREALGRDPEPEPLDDVFVYRGHVVAHIARQSALVTVRAKELGDGDWFHKVMFAGGLHESRPRLVEFLLLSCCQLPW